MIWRACDTTFADAYHRLRRNSHAVVAKDLLRLAQIPSNARLLDLGSGTGALSAAARRTLTAPTITSLDISFAMLLVARRQGAKRLVAGNAVALPFASEYFDVVLANLVLPYVRTPLQVLKEVGRVLHPRGTFSTSSWGVLVSNQALESVDQLWKENLNTQDHHGDNALKTQESAMRDPAYIVSLLTHAGYTEITVDRHTYTWALPLRTYVEIKALALLKECADEPNTQATVRRAVGKVEDALGGRLSHHTRVSEEVVMATALSPRV